MVMARDGFIGGLAEAATAAGTTTARDNGQQQHSTPPFCPLLVVKYSFSALISDRPNQAHTAPPKMCQANLSSWNTCGRGIGDASGHASDAHGFHVVLSLFLMIYFGRAHELSRDMFFPESCSSRDSHKQSLKKT